MKRLKFLALAGLVVILGAAAIRITHGVPSSDAGAPAMDCCGGGSPMAHEQPQSVTKPVPGSKTEVLKVTGIQCQACADRIQESLKALPGVSQAAVTADPPQAKVSYDPKKICKDAFSDAIRKTKPIHAGTPFGISP